MTRSFESFEPVITRQASVGLYGTDGTRQERTIEFAWNFGQWVSDTLVLNEYGLKVRLCLNANLYPLEFYRWL